MRFCCHSILPVKWVMNWLFAAYSSCWSHDISIILHLSASHRDKKRSHLWGKKKIWWVNDVTYYDIQRLRVSKTYWDDLSGRNTQFCCAKHWGTNLSKSLILTFSYKKGNPCQPNLPLSGPNMGCVQSTSQSSGSWVIITFLAWTCETEIRNRYNQHSNIWVGGVSIWGYRNWRS